MGYPACGPKLSGTVMARKSEFDAVQGIIVATLLGVLIWTLIAAGVFH